MGGQRRREGAGQFPAFYAIRFLGGAGPRLKVAFDGEGMELERDGEMTVVSGLVVDQSHLDGLVQRVSILGLALVDVHRRDLPGPSL